MLSGTLSQLVNYTGFAVVLFSAIAVAAVFVLRRRQPDQQRPFSAWGYPWAPATFVVASVLMLANVIWSSPRDLRSPASRSSRQACRFTGGCGGGNPELADFAWRKQVRKANKMAAGNGYDRLRR